MKKSIIKLSVILIAVVLVIGLTSCGFLGNGNDNNGGDESDLKFDVVYAKAVELGFEGSLNDLIEAFKGDSAYQIAKTKGYTGTETEWLLTLVGAKGDAGENGITPQIGNDGNWYIGTTNTGVKAEGIKGDDGKSAFEIYKEIYGYDGTENEWLDELIHGTLSVARYEITFETYGAESDIDPLYVIRGNKIPKPATPVKAGYIFDGWYTDDGFDSEDYWLFLGYIVTSDITLYAKWNAETYALDFDGNGGIPVPQSTNVTFGQSIPVISTIPFRACYEFLGFYDSQNYLEGTQYYDSDLNRVITTWNTPKNVSLYAIWKEWSISGLGTQSEPYNITTKEQLILFANQVNRGAKFSGKFFTLRENIDLGNMEWTPIGKMSLFFEDDFYFNGTFDGDGNAIRNFKITDSLDNAEISIVGLFGYTKGTIKNLGIEDFTISTGLWAGGLAGGFDGGTINNCYATGNVAATSSLYYSFAGGLVGVIYGNSTIRNCYTTGNVIATSFSYPSYAGGLVGNIEGDSITIDNCYVTGNVTATSFDDSCAGGLIGNIKDDLISITIDNCYAAGDITATSSNDCSYAGGLVGKNGTILTGNNGQTTIRNCYAIGNITATNSSSSPSYVGGLVGCAGNFTTIRNCYAIGNITATSYSTTSSNSYAGGLAGYVGMFATISNCFAAGDVSAISNKNVNVGGLIAYIGYSTAITNCYRYEGQIFYREEYAGIFDTANSNAFLWEFLCALSDLNSEEFYIDTLGWDSEIWDFDNLDFENGELPILKVN